MIVDDVVEWLEESGRSGAAGELREWADRMRTDITGSDGTGHCRGCGKPIDRFDPDCPVCMAVLTLQNATVGFSSSALGEAST